jgi:hypothetical protein
MSSDRPTALDRLEVNEVKDGLIVYDPVVDRVHHLNATAAIVFALCDGEHDVATMADVVAAAYGLAAPPLDDVRACLRELTKQGLLA